MRMIRKPKNFEEENWHYLSIGYYKGKAIVKNEMGELFYMECEETIAPIGTVVTRETVMPIQELTNEEREEIEAIYGKSK